MTSRPKQSSSLANTVAIQTKGAEDDSPRVVKSFIAMMDNYSGWSPGELHEDAVMDWFGCCFRGRGAIVYFLRSHVPRTRHIIEKVSKIPPVSHRLIKQSNRSKVTIVSSKLPTEERGQGDCKGMSTPENAVFPNFKELVNAPRIKRPSSSAIDWEKCEFLEIRGKLEFENGPFQAGPDKKLERIILAYTDQIHLIIYEAKNNCRKKLFA